MTAFIARNSELCTHSIASSLLFGIGLVIVYSVLFNTSNTLYSALFDVGLVCRLDLLTCAHQLFVPVLYSPLFCVVVPTHAWLVPT